MMSSNALTVLNYASMEPIIAWASAHALMRRAGNPEDALGIAALPHECYLHVETRARREA